MFLPSLIGHGFVTEIDTVRDTVPKCGQCGKRLSKSLSQEIFYDRAKSIVSFWFIRCPDCRAGHVIFNDTSVLPPVPDPVSIPSASNEAAKTDTNQKQLL